MLFYYATFTEFDSNWKGNKVDLVTCHRQANYNFSFTNYTAIQFYK